MFPVSGAASRTEWRSERLKLSSTPDAQLAEALEPTVEAALNHSVRAEPQIWAEAIFPIVLPAIRLAVTSALQEALRTFNQVLEHSLSLRSWRCRWDAWRTGKPYADVILLRSLVYRVEQVLLMDRRTGLLLCSVAAPDVNPQDAGMISGMLTAIQEFIHDSFEVEESAGIRELHAGDFSLWVEQGPRAALAVAVRGEAPTELRQTLRTAIDLIHRQCPAELRDFDGDAMPFEYSCKAILEGCLQSRYQEPKCESNRKAWFVLGIVALAGAMWIGYRMHCTHQWNHAIRVLQQTPGIMITQAGQHGGNYFVEGLRDPLAGSPERVLADNGIDLRRVSTRFEPFLSLDPKLLGAHARDAMNAPDTVSIDIEEGVLRIEGTAPHAWILQIRTTGRPLMLAGVHEVRTDQLRDIDLESLRGEIEAQPILFPAHSSAVTPEQARIARTVADKTKRWVEGSVAIGRIPELDLRTYASAEGSTERNLGLSRERAAHAAQFLLAAGVPRECLSTRSEGSRYSPGKRKEEALGRAAILKLFYRSPAGAGGGAN